MTSSMRTLILGLPLLLAACGAEQKSPPPPSAQDTVFKDMVSAKDKAREVEAITDQRKDQLDQAVKESE